MARSLSADPGLILFLGLKESIDLLREAALSPEVLTQFIYQFFY